MKQQHKICIISHAHLSNNPRVYKEAVSLTNAGYKVSIVTLLINPKLYDSDLKLLNGYNINYSNSVNLINAGYLNVFYNKAVRKSAQLLSRYLKIETPQALTYNLNQLLERALLEDADLYIGHNEPGLWVGVQLMKKNKKVAFDFEDWYSRDYLVPGRTVNLLSRLENTALKNGKYVTTTSEALAEKLSSVYHSEKPRVIYNAFSLKEQQLSIKNAKESKLALYWFSQNIGPGRGLEQMIESLNLVKNPVSINLRGIISEEYETELRNKLGGTRHELIIHKPVSPTDLVRSMQEFDLGLSLEIKYPQSRDLTVTNKILHYLLGGLPVLASDTSGQKEICEKSQGAIEMIDLNNPEETANTITSFINNPDKLKLMREKAIKVSIEEFNWERQENILLNCVEEALS